jgi:hypothetical protein
MSFFSWFSKKPTPPTNLISEGSARTNSGTSAAVVMPQVLPATVPPLASGPLSADRKVKRHARREQLYVAIRESMTRAGMLSASYKFKVLSLDQNGNQFLVMMDVDQELATSAEKLSQTEEILMQTAKAGYGIIVSAVYWRLDRKTPITLAMPSAVVPQAAASPPLPLPVGSSDMVDAFAKTQANAPDTRDYAAANPADDFAKTQAIAAVTHAKNRNDPLLEAEVAAFKRALAAVPGPAPKPATLMAAQAANGASNAGAVLKSYTLITGFEDTEMPESHAMPALSATQYGELN